MGMLDIDKLMKIARDTVKSAPESLPPEIEEILVGIMVGIYLKGFKHGLKSVTITTDMIGMDIKQAEADLDRLYNLNR